MKYFIIIWSIFLCCFAYASPNSICEVNLNDDMNSPYYGPNTEYGDFHLGWYDPDLFMYDAIMYSNQKYGVCGDWCDSIAEDNVYFIAKKYLWDKIITTEGKKI